VLALLSALLPVRSATADITVVPFEFDPFATHLVAAQWKRGIGCPRPAHSFRRTSARWAHPRPSLIRPARQEIPGTSATKAYAWRHNPHAFVDDADNPYTTPQEKPFTWIRARQVGGRVMVRGHGLHFYRFSDYDFKAASGDGFGVDWPIGRFTAPLGEPAAGPRSGAECGQST